MINKILVIIILIYYLTQIILIIQELQLRQIYLICFRNIVLSFLLLHYM